MSLPPFKFRTPPGSFSKFVESIQVYGQRTNGVPEPPLSRHPDVRMVTELAKRQAAELRLDWTVPYALLEAFMDVLAWWMANTKSGAGSYTDEFAFKLLEDMREWRDRSVVDHIGGIPHE